MKRHVTCFVEKAGFEPRTLGTLFSEGNQRVKSILERHFVNYGSVTSRVPRTSEWDEAHKSAGDSDGHFQPGIFYLENYWVS